MSEDSEAFKHLAPPEDPKKQKQNLLGFKSFFFESKTTHDSLQKQKNPNKENNDLNLPSDNEEVSI